MTVTKYTQNNTSNGMGRFMTGFLTKVIDKQSTKNIRNKYVIDRAA